MKKTILILVSIFMLIGVGAAALLHMVDLTTYRTLAVQSVKDQTGLDLSVSEEIGVGIFPFPHVRVRDLTLIDPRLPNDSQKLVEASELSVSLDLLALITGQLRLAQITVDTPLIYVTKTGTETVNWSSAFATKPSEPASETATQTTDPAKGGAPALSFGDIRIKGAELIYRDNKEQTTVRVPQARVSMDGPSGPLHAEGALGFAQDTIDFTAKLESWDKPGEKIPLSLAITKIEKGIDLLLTGAITPGAEWSMAGEIKASINKPSVFVPDLSDQPALASPITLMGQMIANPQSVEVKNATGTMNTQSFDLPSLRYTMASGMIEGTVEKMPGQAQLSFSGSAKGPLSVTINAVSLAELAQKMFGITGDAITPLHHLRDAALTVSVDRPTLPQTDFDADLAWGQSKIQTKGRFTRPAPTDEPSEARTPAGRPTLDVTLALHNVDLDPFISRPASTRDAIQAQEAASSTTSSPSAIIKNTLRDLALPFDLTLRLEADRLVWQGSDITGLVVDGSLSDTHVEIKKLSIANYRGAGIDGQLAVNRADFSSIAFDVTLRSADTEATLKAFGITPPAMPTPLGNTRLEVQGEGSRDTLATTASLSVYGGTLTLKGPIGDPLGSPRFDNATLSVNHPRAAELMDTLSRQAIQPKGSWTGPLTLEAALTAQDGTYRLNDLTGQMGGSPLRGQLTIVLGADKPALSGSLSADDLKLDDLLGEARTAHNGRAARGASASVASASPGAGAARWSRDAIDARFLHGFDMDLKIALGRFRYQEWVASDLAATIHLQNGSLGINQITGSLFGGTLKAEALASTAKAAENEPISLKINADLAQTDLGMLTNALMGRKANLFEGKVSVATDLKSNGLSTASLVNNLSGSARSDGQNIVIHGLDLEKLVETLSGQTQIFDGAVDLMTRSLKGGSTTFDTHKGGYTIREGVVTIDQLLFDNPTSALNATGDINLVAWSLNSQATITFKPPSTTQPFTMAFSGSLDQPGQTFGGSLVENYLATKLHKKLDKALDGKLGEKLNQLGLGGLLGGAQPKPPVADPAPEEAPASDLEGSIPAPAPDATPAQDNPPAQAQPEDLIKDTLRGLLR